MHLYNADAATLLLVIKTSLYYINFTQGNKEQVVYMMNTGVEFYH